ncbi:MAG TPA: substrate-binding domain-containing protein, partial [Petrotogaceae bacterium]|nr:substrate-binding domain-containing protein [Petrotogaceae bacterium]
SPALTTVRQPIYDIGSKSAEKLLKIIENNKKIKNGIILKNELVIRESTMIRSDCSRQKD